MISATGEQLIVFLKAPRPGEVKSRLAKTLGPEAACAAYCEIVDQLLGEISGLVDVELHFTPADAASEVSHWLRPAWTLQPQCTGDLGDRLAHAFSGAFARGMQRVVIIGSDCASLTTADIREAWAILRQHDLVLGPATDGGYWLIGLSKPQPALFTGIPWSTAAVMEATLSRASKHALTCHLLRKLTDIDTEEDWRHFLTTRAG